MDALSVYSGGYNRILGEESSSVAFLRQDKFVVTGYVADRLPAPPNAPNASESLVPVAVAVVGRSYDLVGTVWSQDARAESAMGRLGRNAFHLLPLGGPDMLKRLPAGVVTLQQMGAEVESGPSLPLLDRSGQPTGMVQRLIRQVAANPQRIGEPAATQSRYTQRLTGTDLTAHEQRLFYVLAEDAAAARKKALALFPTTLTPCHPTWLPAVWKEMEKQGLVRPLVGYNMAGYRFGFTVSQVRELVSGLWRAGRLDRNLMKPYDAVAA